MRLCYPAWSIRFGECFASTKVRSGSVAATRLQATHHIQNMTTLTRWNPIREFESMANRMNSLFARPLLPAGFDETLTPSEWMPLVDVEESDKEYTIKAELPEVKKEDVKVQIEDGSIRICGERKLAKEEQGHRFHRIERSYGAFERSFALPEGTVRSGVKAEFKDGLLRVHLPKGEAEKPKAMEISVA